MTVNTSDNRYATANFIVAPTIAQGANYTTIASALTAAVSGQTIFIKPGTYTENLSLKPGVNLTAFGCDSSLNATGKVIISGTCTLTTAGTVTISGIQLQTNSAALLAITGSAASIVNLNNCYLNCTNTTGITYSSSSGSSKILMSYCSGDIGASGISLYTATGAGVIEMKFCTIGNSVTSTTASSTSACSVGIFNCLIYFPLSTSSTGALVIRNSYFYPGNATATCLTTAGTGVSVIANSFIETGTASALSAGSGTQINVSSTSIYSTNTNAMTGAGSSLLTGVNFLSVAKTNVTTQTGGVGTGLTQGTAPSAGYLGEQISSVIASGSAVSLVNGTAKTITSISLTPGIWNVDLVAAFTASVATTQILANISTTTNTIVGNEGDAFVTSPTSPNGVSQQCLSIPGFRVTLSATTTYYFVARAAFASGASTCYGRISATRVG